MSAAESLAASRRGDTAPSAARSRGQAFGLEVEAGLTVPLARSSRSGRSMRRATLELAHPREVERAWPAGDATTVLERRFPDGRLVMSVERSAQLGYRVYAPWAGRHLVHVDGRRLVSTPPGAAPRRWQRLLFAQVLPLAATLQGLELLHASAVEVDGRTLAFVAASGTGKTSVAAHLVAGGGALLTDDVLALEPSVDGIAGHPGSPLLSIARGELQTLAPAARRRLGRVVGWSDKVILETDVPDRPSRLDALFFLDRSDAVPRLHLERLPPDPFRLLSSAFNVYVGSQQRVVNQLALYARLMQTVPLFGVAIPGSARAAKVATAIREHAEREL